MNGADNFPPLMLVSTKGVHKVPSMVLGAVYGALSVVRPKCQPENDCTAKVTEMLLDLLDSMECGCGKKICPYTMHRNSVFNFLREVEGQNILLLPEDSLSNAKAAIEVCETINEMEPGVPGMNLQDAIFFHQQVARLDYTVAARRKNKK